MPRQVKLFDDSTDSALMVAQCDDDFSSLHFDDGMFPSSHSVFQVNTTQWPGNLVAQHNSSPQSSLPYITLSLVRKNAIFLE